MEHARKEYIMKHRKEFITYLLSGSLTTAVNYTLYLLLLVFTPAYLIANSLSWIGAVLTAYLLNRKWVFHSRNNTRRQFLSFVALRFLTLLVENTLLWFSVQKLFLPPLPAKICVSVITVLANYFLCKYGIFKKEEICHG